LAGKNIGPGFKQNATKKPNHQWRPERPLLGLSQSINEQNYRKKRLPQIGISAREEKDL
jgi:hypothetical protein